MGAAALGILLGATAMAPVEPARTATEAREATRTAPQPDSENPRTLANLRKRFALPSEWGGPGKAGGYIGRGWSVAEDRRRARKARNVARNRKAHK